jgi:hypothetical protein
VSRPTPGGIEWPSSHRVKPRMWLSTGQRA